MTKIVLRDENSFLRVDEELAEELIRIHGYERVSEIPGSAIAVELSGSNVKLLDAVTAIGAGTLQPAGSMKNYVFEVWGTATSFTLQIQVSGTSGNPYKLKVWDELNNTFLSGTDITAKGFYSVSVPAFTSLQANVPAISGGNLSVSGGLMQ